jgi:TolB protein
MRRARLVIVLVAASAWSLHAQWDHRYPAVKGVANGVYLEEFELPVMGAGPTDPAPAPDGRTVAIAARGWLWLLDLTTGEARRITRGAAMDSRSAWAPDGSRLAFVRDDGTDTSIVQHDLKSGTEKVLVSTPAIDLDPVYSHDGRSLYYSSAESGDLDIWRLDLTTGGKTRITSDPGLELRPQLLPGDAQLLFTRKQNPRDSVVLFDLKTHALRVLKEEGIASQMRPALRPDGRSAAVPLPGRNGAAGWDIWLMALDGGPMIHVTHGHHGLPIMPAWSPDGGTVYFVEADAQQRFHLFRTSAWGGEPVDVSPTSWNWGEPTARVRVTTRIASEPRPIPSRVQIVDASGHPVLPEQGQARFDPQNGVVCVYSPGVVTLEVPAGEVTVVAAHGFSAVPASAKRTVNPGEIASIDLELAALWRPERDGWYSGDHHFHLNYGGPFYLTPQDLVPVMQGEDLDVGTPLVANLQTRLNDTEWWGWNRLASGPPLIAVGQEIRPHFFGHMGVIGVAALHWPWYWGPGYEVYGRDDRPNASALRHARDQGGFNYFVHPVRGGPPFPKDLPPANIPLAIVPEAVLGDLDGLEIACIWSDELQTSDLWYRFLNLGIPIVPSGGTDAFPNYYRNMAVGVSRVYARPDGPFNFSTYLTALRRGRSFVTTGPLLNFKVQGSQPGDVLRSDAGSDAAWNLTVASATPFQHLEVLVAGVPVWSTAGPASSGTQSYSGRIKMPAGGWIAARVYGGRSAWPVMESYPFAHTAPIWFNAIGSTDPDAKRQAARDLLRWMDVADERLAQGYGSESIPELKARFAEARSKLAAWAK